MTTRLRIIGGNWRRRTVHYGGDPAVRPMKDRVREALFNILGPRVIERYVLDLFAGTGALAFESLSRGARRAWLFERHLPNHRWIAQTANELGATDRIVAVPGDTFTWASRQAVPTDQPWLVFCCPPYEMFVSQPGPLSKLLQTLWESAPATSLFVVESDDRADISTLWTTGPSVGDWDLRSYPPARIGIAAKPLASA